MGGRRWFFWGGEYIVYPAWGYTQSEDISFPSVLIRSVEVWLTSLLHFVQHVHIAAEYARGRAVDHVRDTRTHWGSWGYTQSWDDEEKSLTQRATGKRARRRRIYTDVARIGPEMSYEWREADAQMSDIVLLQANISGWWGPQRGGGYGGDTLREGIVYANVCGVSPEEAYAWWWDIPWSG